MRKLSGILLICMVFLIQAGILTAEAMAFDMKKTVISSKEEIAMAECIQLQIIENDDLKNSIQCFDVSENGNVAIGMEWAAQKIIYVYDATGTFLYGLAFNCDGAYGIEFVGENINILFLRGNLLATYDSNGICHGIQKLAETEQNYGVMKKILTRTDKTVQGKHYSLERNWNTGDSYSKLIISDEQGEKTVFYDASPQRSFGQSILVIFIISFLGLLIRGCARKATT